eukprot:10297308-Heterocapsa_arctica.AAC.1
MALALGAPLSLGLALLEIPLSFGCAAELFCPGRQDSINALALFLRDLRERVLVLHPLGLSDRPGD